MFEDFVVSSEVVAKWKIIFGVLHKVQSFAWLEKTLF